MQHSFSILSALLFTGMSALSQPPGVGPSGRGPRGPQIKAVEVQADRTVTFHFYAPSAKEITCREFPVFSATFAE